MKKHFFLFPIFLFCSFWLHAQTNVLAQIGGSDQDLSYDIATDNAGNLLVCGDFSGTCDFDPGAGVFNLTASAGAGDGFVAKYSPTGAFLWAAAFECSGLMRCLEVAADASGNIFVGGFFQDTADFDPAPSGTFSLISNGSRDGFFLKLDGADGSLVWAHALGSGGTFEKVEALDISTSGFLYLTGEFENTVDFDPSAGTANLSTSGAGGNQINRTFLAKYDLDAGFVWAKNVGGSVQGFDVWTNSSGDDFLAITGWIGYLQGFPEDFDPNGGTVNPPVPLVQGSYEDIFVAGYTGAGDYNWANFYRNFGQEERGNDVVFGTDGSLYATGNFINNFNNYPGSPLTLDNYGTIGDDAFLLKFNPSGGLVWQKQMGATNQNDDGSRVALDANGNVVVLGAYFNATIELNSAGPSFTQTNAGGYDGFVVSFSPAGDYLWSGKVGGASHDGVSGLAVFGTDVIFSGSFQLTADCDPTPAVGNLTSFGSYDIFITRLTEPAPLDNPPGAQPIAAAAFSSGNLGYFDNNFGAAAASLFPCNGSVVRDVWFKFTAAVANPTLNFTNLNCNSGTTGIEVAVLSGSNLNNFQPVGTCTSPGNSGNFSMQLSNLTIGQTYFVAVDANGAAGCTWQISVGSGAPPPPVCGVPLNRFENDLLPNSVKLNWKNMGATEYQIQFKQNGLAWTTTTTTDTFLTKNNLLAFKAHSWRIRAKCGATWTAYSTTRTFTTPKTGTTCSSPTNLTFSNLTANSVLVDWLPAVGATSYQIKRKINAAGSAWATFTTTADQFLFSNLQANTNYAVQVRTRCGTTWFAWTPVYNFQTPASAAPPADDRDEFLDENFDQNFESNSHSNFDLKIYPNPAHDFVQVQFFSKIEHLENARLEVFDAAGRLVFDDFWEISSGENGYRLPVSDFQKGVFSIRISAGSFSESRLIAVF